MKYTIAGATKEDNDRVIKEMTALIDECDDETVLELLNMTIRVLKERNEKLIELNG